VMEIVRILHTASPCGVNQGAVFLFLFHCANTYQNNVCRHRCSRANSGRRRLSAG
jgi:hypothetical protein